MLDGDADVPTAIYLEVTQTVLDAVFPCKEDLQLLCHVREVDLADTELALGDDDGFLAVVLANRLPQPGVDGDGNLVPRKYLACLINLEGQDKFLPPPVPENVLVDHFSSMAVVQDLREAMAPGGGPVERPDTFAMGLSSQTAALVHGLGGASALGAASARSTARAAPASEAATAWAVGPEEIEALAVKTGDGEVARVVRESMGSAFHLPSAAFLLERSYRFPVLAHWSFTITGEGTFETLMHGLDVALLGSGPPEPTPPKPTATPPPASPRPPVEVAETGHVGLPHQTRRGEHVRAWYRGPLAPQPTVREQPDEEGHLPLAHTADQLRAAVPDGREDLSLAGAFEIGRMLALAQPGVVASLLRWRRDAFGAERARRIVADAALADLFSATLTEATHDLGRLLGRDVVMAAAENPEAKLAPVRPLTDPGRPLRLADGDLGRTLADGLGLELERVQKQASQVGPALALRTTATPLVREVAPDAGISDLHAALDSMVDRLATGAAGRDRVIPHGADAEPEPDALDRLLGEDR